jgi:hypothetical protein
MGWTTAEYRAKLAQLAKQAAPTPASYVAVEREKELHEAIMAECRSRGWITIHARMDRPSTMEVGTPDFIILGSRGRVFIIECKSKSGKLTKAQQVLRAWAHHLGHEIVEVRSKEQFMHVIGKP